MLEGFSHVKYMGKVVLDCNVEMEVKALWNGLKWMNGLGAFFKQHEGDRGQALKYIGNDSNGHYSQFTATSETDPKLSGRRDLSG
jgi:hypothetical protein